MCLLQPFPFFASFWWILVRVPSRLHKKTRKEALEFFAGFSDVQKGLFATKFTITLYYSPLNVKEIVYLDCLKLVATERLNTKGHPSLVRYGHYFHRLFEDSRRLTVGSNLITWRILEQGA
jgi:hypothetical protein